jgi:hypothetical protein
MLELESDNNSTFYIVDDYITIDYETFDIADLEEVWKEYWGTNKLKQKLLKLQKQNRLTSEDWNTLSKHESSGVRKIVAYTGNCLEQFSQ